MAMVPKSKSANFRAGPVFYHHHLFDRVDAPGQDAVKKTSPTQPAESPVEFGRIPVPETTGRAKCSTRAPWGRRFAGIGLAALVEASSGCHPDVHAVAGGPRAATTEAPGLVADWTHDLDAIIDDIERIHPNAFTKIDRRTWLAATIHLKSELPNLTEEQRMVRAMRLVASLGDGHTQLEPNTPAFSLWYPVRVYEFSDGVFITSAFGKDADLAGAQLLEAADHPIAFVLAEARALMGADNSWCLRENLFAFHDAALMKGLGFTDDQGALRVRVKLSSGRIVDRVLVPRVADDTRFARADATMDWRFVSEVFGPPLGSPADWTTAYTGLKAAAFRTDDPTRPPHLMYRRPFVARSLPRANAYYIQINNIQDMQGESLVEFFRRAMREVDSAKPARLIVDIRYNPGGDGSKVTAMIHELIKREDSRPWGHLYVLTGRKTFSAAVMLLQAFIDHTEVSVIGEPAGAGPDSYGDATTIDLRRGRLHVSTLYHKLDDIGERPDFTPVDVPALFSFADYAAGRDPALDPILEGREMRSLALVAKEDGALAARKTYEERRQQFSSLAEWSTPRFINMIRAVGRLEDQKRLGEAVDLSVLVSEMYPSSARAWSVRGDVESAAGRNADALGSFTRALEIDPYNVDNVEQRHALISAGREIPVQAR
jgi:hypothetical protein